MESQQFLLTDIHVPHELLSHQESYITTAVKTYEDSLHATRESIYEIVDRLLDKQGKTISNLTEEDGEALDIFLEYTLLRRDIRKEDYDSLRLKHPNIAEIVDTIENEGLLNEFGEKEGELNSLKSEYAISLEEIAKKKLTIFAKTLNYSLILDTEDDDLPINQHRFIFQDMNDINSLFDSLENPDTNSLVNRYDEANFVISQIQRFLERGRKSGLKQLFLTEESTPPTDIELTESQRIIEKVPEVIKQIDFHNDLAGFLLPNILTEYTDVPSFLNTLNFYLKNIDLTKNPYAVVSIAKKVKLIQESLGGLYTRTSWKDYVTIDKIYEVLEKKDEYDSNVLVSERQETVVDQVLQRYTQLLKSAPSGRLTSMEIQKEEYFIKQLSLVIEEAKPMLPIDERLLRSQLFSLHYLFSRGGINRLYDKYILSLTDKQKPTDKEEENRIKANLAVKFLLQNERKNKEYVFTNDTESTTIGFEYEYDDQLEDVFWENKESIGKYEKANQLLEEIYTIPDSALKEQIVQQIKENLATLKEQIERRNWLLVGNINATLDTLISVASDLRKAQTQTLLVSNLGTFKEDLSYSYREIITTPSNYYRLQQRELLNMLVANNMTDLHLNMHVTIGNVELSPSHPEASDIRPVIESTGWVENAFDEEAIDMVLNKNESVTTEAFWKCTNFYGKLYYLPFHFVRAGRDMLRVNTRHLPQGYELRSFPRSFGNPEMFSNRVRAISFIDLANKAIKASQKSEYSRTEKDISLTNLWNNFTNAWRNLLEENKIKYLPLDQRFIEAEIIKSENSQAIKLLTPDYYTYFLNRLSVESNRNAAFRNSVRTLITNFKHEAKILLGEKKL